MSKLSSDFEADIGKKCTVGKVTVQIENVIAEGGFGVVFLTRNSSSNKKYALKRLYVNEEAKLNACKREIQIMSSLSNHKNMVTFVDSSITRNYKGVWEVLILMQYYSGTCMKIVNDRGSAGLKEQEILKIFCDICEAVSRLHHCQTPIIHRDLKIENILCDSSNTFVLCDFGSATARCYIPGKDERSVTEVEEDINKHTTLSHRSPEMVNLYGHKNITTKADIWALGVTLYRLCFRALPFGESTLAIQTGNLNIPESSPYSRGLHALTCYCLEADPDMRPDIFQVSHIAFLLADRQCPIKNIHDSSLPDLNAVIDSMLNRTSRSSQSATPRASERGAKIEQTTTITPRERPKAARNASQKVSGLAAPSAQRKLLAERNQAETPPAPTIPSLQQLQQSGYTVEQQQYILQQQHQQLEQQRVYYLQQQDMLSMQPPTPQLQTLSQQIALQIQQLTLQQQQLVQLQQEISQASQQQLAQQQLIQQQLAQHLQQEQLAQHLQQEQLAQHLQQEQLARQQLTQQALYEQQQLQQLEQQKRLEEQYKQQLEQQALYKQQSEGVADVQRQYTDGEVQYQLQQLQQQVYAQEYQQALAAQARHLEEEKSHNGQPSPVQNAFEDDFSKSAVFEADFSEANFSTSKSADPPANENIPAAIAEKETAAGGGDELKLHAMPADKPVIKEPVSQPKGRLTPPITLPKRTHRRNVSDTSAISIGTADSAFKAYTPNKTSKALTASLGSISSFASGNVPEVTVVRCKSEDNSLADAAYNGFYFSQLVKSSSAEGSNPNSWNPFADDGDSISDDVMFGQEFDRLRCGSQSSIQNVKSREDLVMLENGSSVNPFEAAPFNPRNKGRQARKEQKIAEKYSRLSTANSSENLLDVEIPAKAQNQTIFGVPIPFTRKSDRTDKYHKVPTDSDTDSLNKEDNKSSDEEALDKTLSASQYQRMENEHSTECSTLTRASQLVTHNGEMYRSHSCDSNYSSTITPPASSTENLSDPFGVVPFASQPTPTTLTDQTGMALHANNPFLAGLQMAADQAEEQSKAAVEQPLAVGVLPSPTAPAVTVEVHSEQMPSPAEKLPTSHSLQNISQKSPTAAPAADNRQHLGTIPKSKTLGSIQTAAASGTGDQPATHEATLKRSQTDYEVRLTDIQFEDDDEDSYNSDTLLSDQHGSMRKKDKGRKSPKGSRGSKPLRHTDGKRSIVYSADADCEGALTNEAFSEQDTGVPVLSESQQPMPAPQMQHKPHPPVSPKPVTDRRPPVALKPKSKSVMETSNKPMAAKPPAGNMQTPLKKPGADAVKMQSKSATKPPPAASVKDAYKTHKRYSSYDLATGRAELSICVDSENSKSALVGKEGKSKKKNKIGLGIF